MGRCLPLAAFSGTRSIRLFSAASSVIVRPNTADYRALFLQDVPMMDVRAPVEFQKGSFPSASNMPLLTNDERHQIGICYKQQGQDAAIVLGQSLVSGGMKADRIKGWTNFLQSHGPDQGYLYCFRGGLRSNIVQQWIEEQTGIHYPIVTGGYKAMRSFLLEELEQSLQPKTTDLIVVCGRTGTGKTRAIQQLKHCSVDLEGLAHHRGSTFGQLPEDPDQPSQINFENSVSIEFLKVLNAAVTPNTKRQKLLVLVEDESNRIGQVTLPPALRDRMTSCDRIVLIEEEMEHRVNVLVEDYILDLGRRFVALYGDELGPDLHRNFFLDGLKRIRNRLGGSGYEQVARAMTAAFRIDQEARTDTSLHRVWITALLELYYDKMYDYQLTQRDDNHVLFRGDRDAVIDWVMTETADQ